MRAFVFSSCPSSTLRSGSLLAHHCARACCRLGAVLAAAGLAVGVALTLLRRRARALSSTVAVCLCVPVCAGVRAGVPVCVCDCVLPCVPACVCPCVPVCVRPPACELQGLPTACSRLPTPAPTAPPSPPPLPWRPTRAHPRGLTHGTWRRRCVAAFRCSRLRMRCTHALKGREENCRALQGF